MKTHEIKGKKRIISPRKARESLQRRRDILDAAEHLFGKHGFFPTSMAQIAASSEFAVGTLYQFFKSKEEIYVALMEEKFDEFIERVRIEVERAPGPMEKIDALIGTKLQFFEKNRDFFRIYATELGGADCSVKGPPGQKLLDRFEGYIGIIADVIREGIRRGLFRADDPMELAYVLNGIMTALIRPWILGADKESLTVKGDLIRGVFLQGVSSRKL